MHRTADLAYWITERYSIKLRREAGLPQAEWTADPNMAIPRYCNVHREDDKVTRWLAEFWRPVYGEVWHFLLARLINNIPTLEFLHAALYAENSLDEIREHLKALRKKGPIFGNAYTVSTSGLSMDKVDYIIDRVLKPAQDFKLRGVTTRTWELSEADAQLQTLTGVSSFMSGQLIADMKNTNGHPLARATDWYTWAAPGPGSLRGLNWYFGDGPQGTVTAAAFTSSIRACKEEVMPLVPAYVPLVHMQDFQNCLCEFSKYMKFKSGDTRVRNRYRPG
jgi:hypothetical protein